jgi:hypothetical protein
MGASTPTSAYYGVRSDSKPSAAPIAVTAPARQAAEPLLPQVPGEAVSATPGRHASRSPGTAARELVLSGLTMLAGGI